MGSSGLILIDFAKQLLGQEKEMKRTMLSEKSQISLKLFKRNLIVGVKNVYS